MALKIAIDGRYLNDHYPGIARYIYHLLRFLPQVSKNEEFFVFYSPTQGDISYISDLTALPDIQWIPTSMAVRGLKGQFHLNRMVERVGAHVFHTPFYLSAMRLKRPSVVSIHDIIYIRRPDLLPSILTRLVYRLAIMRAVNTAKIILTISEATKRDLLRLFRIKPERIIVTLLGAGTEFLPADNETIRQLKARLNLHFPYVLYVGLNKPHKNLVRLIKAWGLVIDQLEKPWRLVIAGKWDSRYPQAKEIAKSAGINHSVLFVGQIPEEDMAALYSGAELFVFPSMYEGFGLPVIEAMACGTAIACSNRASLPEIAGSAASFFNPYEIDSISKTILTFLNASQLRQKYARLGIERARMFSWETTARLTLEAYRRAFYQNP